MRLFVIYKILQRGTGSIRAEHVASTEIGSISVSGVWEFVRGGGGGEVGGRRETESDFGLDTTRSTFSTPSEHYNLEVTREARCDKVRTRAFKAH